MCSSPKEIQVAFIMSMELTTAPIFISNAEQFLYAENCELSN
jgi:hypothetical protein